MFEQKDIILKDSLNPTHSWGGSSTEAISRIVSALYMVTGLLSDNEPLKGHLRNKALNIFSEIVSFVKDKKKTVLDIQISLEEIMSLIDTGGRAGLISQMNRNVLLEEIIRFSNTLEEFGTKGLTNLVSDITTLFHTPLSTPKEEPLKPVFMPRISKGHFDKGRISKNVLYKKQKDDAPKKKAGNEDRKETIIGILKQKGETTIKDISSGIPDCSEKTIQRDLNELVDKGRVKKKGERRWTTYLL
ncbi:MAG: DeoR family transcriptional regulator [Patescibacteria group bacterium]